MICLQILALALVPSSPQEACEPPWPEVNTPESCRLFGDPAAVEANRDRRVAHLELVQDSENCVEVVYVNDWGRSPELVSFTDVELVETFLAPGCESAALVEIVLEGATEICERGAYVVGVDDSLGDSGQVLAILDGLMLIELDDQLRFLLTADAEAPACWRMIWHPPWRLAPPSRGAPATPKRPNSRNRRNRR